MSNEVPWTEKYRPHSVAEVDAQEEVVAVLSKTVASQNLPHMLFYGPPGTGKTSTILALARQLYGPNGFKGRVLELNASDERGIDVIREKVKTFARIAVSHGAQPGPPFKIIVLDEADSMTTDAQSALRRIMENYSKVTRFCLICNYVSRIIDPLASRCAKLRFKPVPLTSVISKLDLICREEQLDCEPTALEFLAKVSAGDLRKAITLLQSIKKMNFTNRTTTDLVAEISGTIPDAAMTPVIDAWLASNVQKLETELKQLIRMGYSGVQFIYQLTDLIVSNPNMSEKQKCKVALSLGSADHALVDGADEHLQIMKLLITTMA
eukprot:jgi/Hompol1/3137/HPOL_003182-RA